MSNFTYDYRNDNDRDSNKGLAKTAIILVIISALLVALSYFVLIEKKESLEKDIPALKENKEKLSKEVEDLNNSIKHSEENYKKAEERINKYK